MEKSKHNRNNRGNPDDHNYRKSVFPQILKEYVYYLKSHEKRGDEIKQRKRNVEQFLKDLYSDGLDHIENLSGKRIYQIVENKEISFWFSVSIRGFLKYLYLYSN